MSEFTHRPKNERASLEPTLCPMTKLGSLRLDRLTVENWRTSGRLRHSGGTRIATWIEELPDGCYRTAFAARPASRQRKSAARSTPHSGTPTATATEFVDNCGESGPDP